MTDLLSIIIVNFNGMHILPGCLQSIAEHADCPHEVIIVDNASTDESRAYISAHHQDVLLAASEKNLGFAGGCNLGAALAKGTLLLMLNNDTLLLSSLTPALRLFDDSEKLGVLGCRMTYGDGRLQPSIGYEATPMRVVLSWTGLGRFKWAPAVFKRTESNEAYYSTYHADVAWISGAFLMTRAQVWTKLHGMYGEYHMYVEDTDYCKRTRLAGHYVAYTPDVRIIHYEGGGKAWLGAEALQSTMRSYFIYMKRFEARFAVKFIWLGLSIVMTARAAAFSVWAVLSKSDVPRQKAKAYWELPCHLYNLQKEYGK